MPATGYEIRELDWDTKFFGLKMGEVLLPTTLKTFQFLKQDWQRTLDIARFQGYQFLFCAFEANHPEIAAVVSAYGATIGDILVTFSLPCTKELGKRKLRYRISEAEPSDLSGILQIAGTGFRESRFLQDPHFERAKAEQFYPSWLQESFFNSEKILAIKDAQQVLGFITLKPQTQTGVLIIGLIAVSESWQGKGVGQTLIDQAINLAIDHKYNRIQVGTQLTNYPAINLYGKNGFRVINAKYRYHIWMNKMPNLQVVKGKPLP